MKSLNIRSWRLAVLVGSIGVIVWKSPLLLLEPRLWAEEGTGYFSYAYHFANSPAWYKGLTNIQTGYLSLWPNIASTVAANLFALEYVPFVTTALALTVQLIVIAVILWGKSEFWQTPVQKIFGVSVVLLVPLSGEIWLNTINCQFVFALSTFLILHSNADASKMTNRLYRVLLLVAGLDGIVSCLLAPWFILKALTEKTKERVIHLVIICSCAITQAIIVFLSSAQRGPHIFTQWVGMGWQTLVAIIWTRSIGFIIFGLENTYDFSLLFRTASTPLELNLMSVMVLFIEIVFIWFLFLSSSIKKQDRITLIGSYLIIIVVSIIGSLESDKSLLINPGIGTRYFYTSNAILMLIVVANIQIPIGTGEVKGLWKSILLIALSAISVYWGVMQYQETCIGTDWPRWREQVQMWRENHEHNIEIWPPGWKMQLKK